MKVNIYIYWILDLEDQMHLIRDLWISGFQECKGNGFSEVGRVGSSFSQLYKRWMFWTGGCPCPQTWCRMWLLKFLNENVHATAILS